MKLSVLKENVTCAIDALLLKITKLEDVNKNLNNQIESLRQSNYELKKEYKELKKDHEKIEGRGQVLQKMNDDLKDMLGHSDNQMELPIIQEEEYDFSDALLDVNEAGDYLGVSSSTISRASKFGALEFEKIGRKKMFKVDDLDKLKEAGYIKPRRDPKKLKDILI